LGYLKSVCQVGQDILEHGRLVIKSQDTNSSVRVNQLFQEESAILNVLHLTFIALMNAPHKISRNVMQELIALNKSGIALQKLIAATKDINGWLFLVDLNSLSTVLISRLLSSLINKTRDDEKFILLIHPDLRSFKDSCLLARAVAPTVETIREFNFCFKI
jgi:hypothetical protein